MKRPLTTTSHSTDFDVISGPSMASACPVVDSVPAEAIKEAPASTDRAQADGARAESRDAAA